MLNLNQYLEEDFPKNLSIDIGSKHSFKNYKSITDWYDTEEKFFKSIGNPLNIINTFHSHIKNPIYAKFNQNRNVKYTIDDLLLELKDYIEITYNSQGIISSKSKVGIWLLNQHKQNGSLTVGSFTYFQNKLKNVSNVTTSKRDGHFSAYLFDNNIQPNFEEEKVQYESFYKDIIQQKDEILEELIDIRERNKELNKIISKQNTDWDDTFKIKETEIRNRFNKEYDRHQSKMSESEKFYEKKLAVKSAVTYWSEKAKSHMRNSIIFGSIVGILMLAVIALIFIMAKYLIGLDMSDDKGEGRKILTESGALQLWVYGFFIITMTIIIWFIRLLVKVFLSNLHLLSDAKERVTMIQTYLAFEREENTLKDTDRDLILPSIFRVSVNGFIKEDSSPNSAINIITKKITD